MKIKPITKICDSMLSQTALNFDSTLSRTLLSLAHRCIGQHSGSNPIAIAHCEENGLTRVESKTVQSGDHIFNHRYACVCGHKSPTFVPT